MKTGHGVPPPEQLAVRTVSADVPVTLGAPRLLGAEVVPIQSVRATTFRMIWARFQRRRCRY